MTIPSTESLPEFIQPKTVLQLRIEELHAEIAKKQERRLLAVGALEKTSKQRLAATNEKVAEAFEKRERKIAKLLERIDKTFEEINAELTRCRALQLQYDDNASAENLIKGV